MDAVAWIAAIAAMIVAVAGAARVLWRIFITAVDSAVGGRIDRIHTTIGEQDGDFDRRIDEIHTRLDAIAHCVAEVRSQVYPNSGSSLRDRVDELYELVASS